MLGGGGVDGAIHRAAGPQLVEDCRNIRKRQGGLEVGKAVITKAGNLPAKFVIHTVGPVWVDGTNQEEFLLASAYRNSLVLAAAHQAVSVSFPNISTGRYRFPKEDAARIAFDTVLDFVAYSDVVARILFVCYDEENYDIYQRLQGE